MLRMTHLALAVAFGAGTTAAAGAAAAVGDDVAQDPQASAVIKNAEGQHVGTLTIADADGGMAEITVKGEGLPAGYHGLHLHEKGVCDPAATDPATGSPFASAGSHFDLNGHDHGEHSGDLPDLLVNADGTGSATAVTDRFEIGQLFDSDGTAVIIHVLADNQSNIPDRYTDPTGEKGPDADTLKTGDSGGRLACGVLTQPEP
ncbi:superoxide dismutase family protein [Actinocorallia sp. API 0066]|uniref:superoxide dismutase family protein n=1 Tax=Actinocorallia sp. API 0066 TaxID=2896846 RepID=UPI001E5F272C|nr:superoxide dismutase family protein [Actinocorallia sp. API 0066]MCD0451206.1 superoxide dismutase family protein [Actinocorallia sp. API 0066]